VAHILIVDDRAANRELLVSLLGHYGHTLDVASDGAEALERVRERKPDLVITDLLMPNVDGEELASRLRADPATVAVPVILYTATYRAREARVIADRVGAEALLAKPSEPQVIVATVNSALGALAGAHGSPVAPAPVAPDGKISRSFTSFEELNRHLAALLETAIGITDKQGLPLASLHPLEDLLQNVRSLSLRVARMGELGHELAGANTPPELLNMFCAALQDILSSRYAGVVIADGDERQHFRARGLDPEQSTRVEQEIEKCPAATMIRGPDGTGRLIVGVKPTDFTGLPASHPTVSNFFACPLVAHGRLIGWQYVAEHMGGDPYATEDERIATALGAQFATAWQSLARHGKLEQLVVERTLQLEISNRDLEAFSYSVSHDLRAPLRAVDGYSRMLLEDHAADLPAAAQRLLHKVGEQASHMAELINVLLELARVGRRELELHPVKLGDFVRNCWSEQSAQRAGRSVELVVGDLPVWNGDPILLKQLFLNLLSNALKYTAKRAAARVEIGAERRGAEQIVFVRDNGAGFDMAKAQKLFGAFQRLHTQEEYRGTGVGLAIVRRVAERHGARVWAEAAPERGATFYIGFPALPASP
jgi:signal transduction histidine kinase/CheY-like chemotaxis protein